MKETKPPKSDLYNLIAKSLNIDVATVSDDLSVGSISEWDSLAHVGLIAAVELEYDIQFEIDEVIDLEEVIDFWEIICEKRA